MEKKTPLYNKHLLYHGSMVPFAGYLMPVQYENGILHEHRLVRSKAGLFDVSHMGELILEGRDALANLQYLLTNDYRSLEIGKIRYGVLVKPNGTAVDDLLVYHLDENKYLLVVNASNTDKDEAWIRDHLEGSVTLSNFSDVIGQLAIQGPSSKAIMSKLCDTLPEEYYSFVNHVKVGGLDCLVSATGYTGEAGYEIYLPAKHTVSLFEKIMEAGADYDLEPCGLGARDTLRLEASMPLYGHELSEDITPLEAGLKMFVKLEKERFIACEALAIAPKRRRIGLKLTDRGIARENTPVYVGDRCIGTVTSGTMSPTLNEAVAMALIDAEYLTQTEFELDVRGRKLHAVKVPMPFYKRKP